MENTGIVRLVNRNLNGSTATGDLNPGGAFAFPGNPNAYIGQVGSVMFLKSSGAAAHSDTANGGVVLAGGRYQYVQFAADGTNYTAGQLLYWKDPVNYIVTNVAPSATTAAVAGFCIAPVTQGNYWLIQTRGLCWATFAATASSHTAGVGVYQVVNTATVNSLADATADATAGVAKLLVGIAYDAPSDAGTTRIMARGLFEVE